MANVDIDVDKFALALEKMTEHIGQVAQDSLNFAVERSSKEGKKALRRVARQTFRRTGAYAKSWQAKMDSKGERPQAHIYSTKPGLPHLLEKGHATVGKSRFVPGKEHISPVADATFDLCEKYLKEDLHERL